MKGSKQEREQVGKLWLGNDSLIHLAPDIKIYGTMKFSKSIKILLMCVTPSYILKDLVGHVWKKRAISASVRFILWTPEAQLKAEGDAVFAVRAPSLSESLSEETRSADTVISFKSPLKTQFL